MYTINFFLILPKIKDLLIFKVKVKQKILSEIQTLLTHSTIFFAIF